MRFRIKSTKLTLKIISWLQIIGGFTGILLVAYLMIQTETINGPVLLIFLTGLSLFIYSIYAGERLLTDENKGTAIIHSIVNQAIQLFQWKMLGYGLSYSSGAEIILGVEDGSFKFKLSAIASNFNMSINSDDLFFIKINLFAAFILIVLIDILMEQKGQYPREIKSEVTAEKT